MVDRGRAVDSLLVVYRGRAADSLLMVDPGTAVDSVQDACYGFSKARNTSPIDERVT